MTLKPESEPEFERESDADIPKSLRKQTLYLFDKGTDSVVIVGMLVGFITYALLNLVTYADLPAWPAFFESALAGLINGALVAFVGAFCRRALRRSQLRHARAEGIVPSNWTPPDNRGR